MIAIKDIEAFVIMSTIPGLGPIKIRQALEFFGSATDVLLTPQDKIAALPGFERIAPYWNDWKTNHSWRSTIETAEKSNTQMITFTHPQFPKSLKNLPDCPVLLYIRGSLNPIDTQRSIAIVGTRQASIYGLEMADSLSHSLASKGFTIISGLARGIDTAAHQAAIKCGRTLAVIGSGLNDIYPPENRSLAATITHHGALISEFPMDTPPDRQNFPQRNRIVSALSTGVLLIEAPIKSGAMITMEKAISQKKKLFAIPGRADSENFRGNHLLIKNGQARLIESAEDILSHYDELFPMNAVKQLTEKSVLSVEEKSFLDLLPVEELNIEAISKLVKMPMNQINNLLMRLLLKRQIKEYPGKIYKKSH